MARRPLPPIGASANAPRSIKAARAGLPWPPVPDQPPWRLVTQIKSEGCYELGRDSRKPQ
jgi:hypothetical protein